MTTPQIGDIWKSYYTDDRYEPNYYLIQKEAVKIGKGNYRIDYPTCIHLNSGTTATFNYYVGGKREADNDVWEIIEQVG